MKFVKVSALWCPSCLVMASVFDDASKELNIDLIKYDFDLDEEIVKKFNVGNILPVLIKLDENDNEIDRLIGEHSKNEVKKFMEGSK